MGATYTYPEKTAHRSVEAKCSYSDILNYALQRSQMDLAAAPGLHAIFVSFYQQAFRL